MKGKIKILALVLALAMVASMFVACSGNGDTASTPDTSAPVAGDSSDAGEPAVDYNPAMAELTEISWYIWGNEPSQAAPVIAALNEKSAADVNIKVNFKWQTGDDTSLKTTLASGDTDVDIAFACGWFADYVGNSQKGYFRDLTEDVQTYAPTLYETLPELMWQGVQVNGKIYGVPVWKDCAASQYWFARKDIVEAADAVAEFEATGRKVSSLKPVLQKIKDWHDADPTNNAYTEGLTAPMNFNWAGLNGHNNGWDELHAPTRLGVKIVDGNTKVESYYADADYRDDMKALKEFADLGLTNGKEAVQIEQEPTVCVVSTGQGWDGAQYDAWGGPKKGYETIISLKCGPYLTSGYVQGGVNCVGAGSTKVEAALKYLQYLDTNAEYQNTIAYGIEGTNWKNVNGRAEVLTGEDWAPGGFVLGSWQHKLPPVVKTEDGYADEANQTPTDMWKVLCESVNTAQGSDLLGFVVDISNVENQISACASIVEENYKALQCGVVDDVDAYCDTLLEKLEAVGYNEIIADFQAQVDAFIG